MGFIDKLGEMYRIRKILRDLKQEMEHSNGLSTGYARNEAKFIADQILHFRSTYLQSVMAPKVKELDITIHKIANKARFEFYVGVYNALRLQCEKEYDIFMNRDIWVVVADCQNVNFSLPPMMLKFLHILNQTWLTLLMELWVF